MGQTSWGSLHNEFLFAEVMRTYSSVCVEIIGVGTLMTELINLSFANRTMDLISLVDRLLCMAAGSRAAEFVLTSSLTVTSCKAQRFWDLHLVPPHLYSCAYLLLNSPHTCNDSKRLVVCIKVVYAA